MKGDTLRGILPIHKGNKARVAPDLSTRLGAALRKSKRGNVQPAFPKSKPDGHRALGLVATIILLAMMVLPLIPTGTVLADMTVRTPTTGGLSFSSATNNMVVNKPTNTAEGDFLAIAIGLQIRGNTPTISPPSGWTELRAVTQNNDRFWLYYKVAGGSEPSSYTWTFTQTEGGSTNYAVAIMQCVVSGSFDPDDPIDAYSTTLYDSSDTIVRAVMTTNEANQAMLFWACRANFSGTFSPPTVPDTWTEDKDYNWAAYICMEAAHLFWTGSGATGNIDATLSASGTRKHAFAIALNPPPAPDPPTVVTLNATDVSYTTATVNGNITATGGADVTTRGFEWGTAEGGPYPNDWHEDGTFGTGTFSRGLTGLSHNTTYFFRAYATNEAGTSYGGEEGFATLLCTAPTVVTDSAIDVSYTIATLQGIIMDVGSVNATMRGFEWGTSTGVYTWSWNQTGDYGDGGFEHDLTGLDDDTTYFYRAYAANPGGTSYGLEEDFTTTAYAAPTVVTNNATDVSYTTATLNGNITDVDGDNADTRGFQWGTATGVYDWSWNQTGDYGTGAFDHGPTGLDAGQTFYFRAFAINEGGTGYGAELSFTTLAYVAATVVTLNATAIGETLATISGNITSIGSHNVTERGYDWGYATGNYTGNWTEAGDFGIGAFSHNLTSLPYNTTIYYRGKAQNLGGWAYGAELTFTTLLPYPGAPANFTITKLGYSTFELTWDMGTLAATTVIRVSETAYPASVTDGILVYSGNGGSVILDSLNPDMTSYYYTAWSENNRGYSHDAAQEELSYPLTVIQAMFIVALCIIGFWKRGWIRIMAAIGIVIWGAYLTPYDLKLAAPLIGIGALLFFMSIYRLSQREASA